jgi:hypothetical protein
MCSAKQNLAADIAVLKGQLAEVLAVLLALANAVRESEVGSYTLEQFRTRHKLSESQYHKLRRQGRGPRVMSVGDYGQRISLQADLDWTVEREAEAEAEAEAAQQIEKPTAALKPMNSRLLEASRESPPRSSPHRTRLPINGSGRRE